jgi:16S rRNA (cytidine1402-2'-O)-methyltransferase
VLVVGGAGGPADRGVDPRAVDAVRRLVDAGARPRPAAAVVAELTGGSANALYAALQEHDAPSRNRDAPQRNRDIPPQD